MYGLHVENNALPLSFPTLSQNHLNLFLYIIFFLLTNCLPSNFQERNIPHTEREREREMGAMVVLILAASILMGCTNLAQGWASPASPASPEIRVAGKVLCQDCTRPWNEWVHGANPIKGNNNIFLGLKKKIESFSKVT